MPHERRHARRRRVRLRWATLSALVLLSPVIFSYTTTMRHPSSLPLGVRSVEWLRNNHGNWLVDEAEHFYYSWKAPKKGGPQLQPLPAVGLGARARTHEAAWPRRIKPVVAHPLPGAGAWKRPGLSPRGDRGLPAP